MIRRILTALCIAGTVSTGSLHGQSEPSLAALDSLLGMRVSSASSYEQFQSDAPAFVSIVTREEILSLGYETLEDVLRSQVGFYSGTDRSYSDVGVRGLGRSGQYNNRILLLVDGHSVNDDFTGGTRVGSTLNIDMDLVQRIEIVRGPGSSLYGARAMLAVINLITRKGRDIDGFTVVGEMGSFGETRGAFRYGRVLGADSDLTVAASYSESDGENLYFPEYDLEQWNSGVAESRDWEQRTSALATLRTGSLLVQGGASFRDKGVPTAPYGTVFNHPETETLDRSIFAHVGYNRPVGERVELSFELGSDWMINEGHWPVVLGVTGVPQIVTHKIDMKSISGGASLDWEPSSSQRIVAGVEGMDAVDVALTGTAWNVRGELDYSMISAFVHQELQITEDVSLTMGIRRDEYSSIGGATTPRAALVVNPASAPNSTFKLMAGEAFRAPNLLELAATSFVAGMLSNPDLTPERVRTLEATWEHRFGRAVTTVSAFQNQVTDLVDLVQIALPDSLRQFGNFAFQHTNIGSMTARGIEVEARAALTNGVRLHGGYSFTHAVDGQRGGDVINAPRHLGKATLFWAVPELATVGLSARAETSRRTLYSTETKGGALVDLTLSRDLSSDSAVRLRIDNIFDDCITVPGGFQHLQSAIPQPGRRFSLRFEHKF